MSDSEDDLTEYDYNATLRSDKVIAVNSESERRMHQRRREDQVRTLEQAADLLARERRYALLQAAVALDIAWLFMKPVGQAADKELMVDRAEELLGEIERRERERQGKDETK